MHEISRNHDAFSLQLDEWLELAEFQKQGWIFRGHGSFNYDLKSSLEHLCVHERSEWELSKARELEEILEREFQRHYHLYSPTLLLPEDEGHLEWLSIMQHHGAPTRLLDFTYSIWIAAYFALEKATDKDGKPQDSAIWATNFEWASDSAVKKYEGATEMQDYIRDGLPAKDYKAFDELTINNDKAIKHFLMVGPYRRHPRLAVQQGVFACPVDVCASFMENLKEMPEWDKEKNLICIKIPADLRNEGLRQLHYMGINRTSLFPGLDGFAESLNYAFPLVWKDIREREGKI